MSGVLSLAIMSISIFGLPSAISDFRSSVMLKRIGATPIKPWMFVFTVVTFYMALTVFTVSWVLVWIAILSAAESANALEKTGVVARFEGVNWGSFFFTFLYTVILATTTGMFIVSIARTTNAVQTIAMFVSMSANFLGGQVIPLSQIAKNDALNVISHIVPFRYTVSMFNQTFDGSSVFSGFGTDFITVKVVEDVGPVYQTLFKDFDRILNFVMPMVFVGIFFTMASLTFQWSSRDQSGALVKIYLRVRRLFPTPKPKTRMVEAVSREVRP